jgi:hypothetical protein
MYEIMRIKTMQNINYSPTEIEIYRKTETKTDSGGIAESYSFFDSGIDIRLYNQKTELINNETGEKKVYTTKALCKYDINIKKGDKIKEVLNSNREFEVKIVTPHKFQGELVKYELVLEEL